MSDLLGKLFIQFVKERVYLKNVTPKTRVWYETSWKAFRASQTAADELNGDEAVCLTKAHLQAFVVQLRSREVSARTVNTYLQALNAFGRWLHEEGHQPQPIRLPLLRTESRVVATLTDAQIRVFVHFRPKNFDQWRVFTLDCLLLDTGMRIEEALTLEDANVDTAGL